ncbi:MAG: tRNA (N6-isopentenyl adenosine(37)-C2)-methylthiotransferase MiaB [Deltaproteobacteria bacterium]|nr:tRNA (N6-isopentenyl adenosine(37)-C2)-methylthiotransferase MiaB [Deltaproteobacteria bacterium]
MPGFSVTTFGCQMNQHDSERMEEVLRGGGATSTSEDAADVVILNTCSVREKAEQKLRSEVGRWAKVKRERPDLILVVAGCMAQQEGRKILQRMPAVDLVVGPDNIPELPELLAELRLGSPPIVRTEFDLDAPRFLTAPSTAGDRPTAFVTTMKGCNERCSFCVVPNTRGPERYRPSAELLREIEELVLRGVREITLLGQTVNSYRDPLGALPRAPGADPDDPDESEFAALLRAIAAAVPELARIRYTSPHPRHLTPSLIAAHRDLVQLPHHVHLPVQSGSDRVLKRMIRRHRREEYVERLARLRQAVPDITISTDLIVGFPGETEEDFAATLSLIEEVGFVGVFGFKYSRRPNTPALRIEDDVPDTEKSARLARVFEISERLVREHLERQVGRTLRVLVEGVSKAREENATGRSERNEIVHIEEGASVAATRLGEIVEVEVVEAYKHSLLGRLTAAEKSRTPQPRATRAKRSLPLVPVS